MQTITKPAQIFRAVFQIIKNRRIDWYSNHENDSNFCWYFKYPFTIFRRVEEHIGDRHSTLMKCTLYKRYFWQVEWRYQRSEEIDVADEYFAPSEDTWGR
mgnify:CR=1 FL=1|jgi:hypothetical protein